MNHYSEFVVKQSINLLIEYIGKTLERYCKEHYYSFIVKDEYFITIKTNDVVKGKLVKSIVIPKNMGYSDIIIEFNPREKEDPFFKYYEWAKEYYGKTKLSLNELPYGILSAICDFIEDFIDVA